MEQLILLDYQPVKSENLLIYYKGPFSASVLSKISMNIRRHLSRSKRVAKKVFSIFIELAQNVALYSAELNHMGEGGDNHSGVGVFVIEDVGDCYLLTVGNLVSKEDGLRVQERVENINQLEEDALREFKISQRAQPRRDGKHGANIGLIHVALQAGHPFTYHVREVDQNYSFLMLNIKVAKITASNSVEQYAAE